MVVPKMPTTTAAAAAFGTNVGHTVCANTWRQGTCTVNSTAAYASNDSVSHFKKPT